MAQNATLLIDQGTTYRARVFLVITGTTTPFDLTGCTAAELQIRPNYGSPLVWADLTVDGGGLVLGGIAGTIDLLITAEETAAIPMPALANQQLPVARGVFDIALTLPSGDVVRCLQGTISASAGVTLPGGPSAPQ